MLSQLTERMQKWDFSCDGLRDVHRRGLRPLPTSPLPSLLFCSLRVTIALGSLLNLGLRLTLATLPSLKARRKELRHCLCHSGYADSMTSTLAIVPLLPWLDWR